uniref:Ribbon-helix-helix protein, CopG family n=1 Tax=Muribaculaceae bacterium Z82 TaxID=2304548 RepID=A0A7C9JPG4_9BACT
MGQSMVFELIIALAQSFCIMRGGRFSLFGPEIRQNLRFRKSGVQNESSNLQYKARSISATVSRELYGQVAACAKVKDRSMSWVVREALKAHLG